MKRKLWAGLISAALVLGVSPAWGITWTLVEAADVDLNWPNEFNAVNGLEANGGLLGRIVAHTSDATNNACELAESHPCASGEPPAGLGTFAGGVEGPPNVGTAGAVECNRKVIACGTGTIPGSHSGHPGSNTPNETPIGEFSFFVLHRSTGAKSMAFISGSYVTSQGAFACNSCPPSGPGRDIADAAALAAPRIAASLTSTSVSLWTTQFVDGVGGTGHTAITLSAAGAGAVSACGNGVQFETLTLDPCRDTSYPVPVKWDVATYNTTFPFQFPTNAAPWRCDGPDCYVRAVIVPAARALDPNVLSIQVRKASAVLPANSPFGMANATLDVILFAYTSQLIDADGDTVEDRVDPCPQDPTDLCVQNLFGSGPCPAGQIFCANTLGALACRDPFLCSGRMDPNQDCLADGGDFGRIAGEDDGGAEPDGNEAFGSGLAIGPFDP